jgi:predicted metal-binding protein
MRAQSLNLFEEKKLYLHIEPIIEDWVRVMCLNAYPLHPKGCPNWGKSDRCPPKVSFFDSIYDLSYPVYAIINEFDLAAHVSKMKKTHPDWSDRQLKCVLYWQNTARKQLNEKINKALLDRKFRTYTATWCPEGMGVNVTETLNKIGVFLEWPPERIVRQVAILAQPKALL